MSASERQVAGDHYRSSLQHWDFISSFCGFGPEYYIGCAGKYLTRHRKKNGRQDLEKAVHFIEKLIERHAQMVGEMDGKNVSVLTASAGIRMRCFPKRGPGIAAIRHFCAANDVSTEGHEFNALVFLHMATQVGDYKSAKEEIEMLLEKEYAPPEPDTGPATVPILYNPPLPAPGFVWEGQSGNTEFHQCMRCGEHITTPEGIAPADVHRCNSSRG